MPKRGIAYEIFSFLCIAPAMVVIGTLIVGAVALTMYEKMNTTDDKEKK